MADLSQDRDRAAPITTAQIPAALQQGLNLLNAGRPADALALSQRVITTDRSIADAHFLAGLALQRLWEDDRAIDAFREVTATDPRNAAGWAHLAESLLRRGRYDEARPALDKAIEHDHGNPFVQQVIAMTLSSLTAHDQALGWFRRATEARPTNVGFLLNLANCEISCGELDAAESTLERALRIEPEQPNVHWLLSVVRCATDRQHVNAMQTLIASGRYPPAGLALLHYACGKELEDLESWADAFSAFSAGAEAKRSTIEYDEASETAVFHTLAAGLTREWLDDGSAGHSEGAPIFILGQPRSGTTLVERIVAAHSAVHSAGELRQFGDSLAKLAGCEDATRISADVARAAATVDAARLGAAYMTSTAHLAGDADHFIDKYPGNFLYVPLILKALPRARVIHLRRSPMDTCFSVFKQLFTGAYPYSYDLLETGRHYARYHRLMETWRCHFGDRFIDISYEEIAADPEPNTRRLLEFLDLPFERACLSFHTQSGAVTTASAVQVRQPAYTKSIGRWRRYEQSLEPLRRLLVDEGVPLE